MALRGYAGGPGKNVRVLTDPWSAAGAYEPYIGRWSRLVAEEFLAWLRLPRAARCLDVGSGTGALSAELHRAVPGAFVVGVDPSEDYVGYAQDRDKRGLYVVAGAQGLPFADRVFDAAVSGLVLNFVPDPGRMLREMRRVVRDDGTVAVYVWDYADEMQMIRRFWDAAVSLDAEARDLDEGRRFPITNPSALVELFGAAGLHDVGWREIEVPTVFRDFDDYWEPFLGSQGPAPAYAMGLAEDDRLRLRDRLREALTTEPDGSIRMTARAWAVRGVR